MTREPHESHRENPIDALTEEIARAHEFTQAPRTDGDFLHRVVSITTVCDERESFVCSCGALFTEKTAYAELGRRREVIELRALEEQKRVKFACWLVGILGTLGDGPEIATRILGKGEIGMSVFEVRSGLVGEITPRAHCDSCNSDTYAPGSLRSCAVCAATKCSNCDLGAEICLYCDYPDEDSADEDF